jgi:hypothetical protein
LVEVIARKVSEIGSQVKKFKNTPSTLLAKSFALIAENIKNIIFFKQVRITIPKTATTSFHA